MSEESVNSRRCKGGNLFFSRILFCICLCGPVAYALAEESTVVSEIRQNEKKSISGVVTDTNDEPLIGATVLVKGTQNGTVTDVDGRFHLKVNSGETLVVSYIGMKSKEVAVVDGKKELFIRLDADTEMLDEVLVTGYQTLSKERSTGAFSKVSTEKLELKRMDNLSSMLEGQVAGYVNGQIRGVTTMNAVANPMVVIDGFPVENTTLDRIGQTTENMPDLNPEDIESVTVLKDAAAASIYGARAANGVIVITTKKAKEGKAEVSFSSTFTVHPYSYYKKNRTNAADVIAMEREWATMALSTPEAAEMQAADLRENGPYPSLGVNTLLDMYTGKISMAEGDKILNQLASYGYQYYDQAEKYGKRNPFYQQYNLRVGKTTERNSFNFSTTYWDNDYEDINHSDWKLGINITNSLQLTNWLHFDTGVYLKYGKEKNQSYDLFDPGFSVMPYDPLVNADGSYFVAPSQSDKSRRDLVDQYGLYSEDLVPMDELNYALNTTKTFETRAYAKLKFDLTSWLNYNVMFQYETSDSDYESLGEKESNFMRKRINDFTSKSPNGSSLVYNLPNGDSFHTLKNSKHSYNFRQQLSLDKTFDEKHNLVWILGQEVRHSLINFDENTVYGYDPELKTWQNYNMKDLAYFSGLLGSAQLDQNSIASSRELLNRFVSFYSNASYTYDDKYVLSGSIRWDRSNLWGTNSKYQNKPLWSVGGAAGAGLDQILVAVDRGAAGDGVDGAVQVLARDDGLVAVHAAEALADKILAAGHGLFDHLGIGQLHAGHADKVTHALLQEALGRLGVLDGVDGDDRHVHSGLDGLGQILSPTLGAVARLDHGRCAGIHAAGHIEVIHIRLEVFGDLGAGSEIVAALDEVIAVDARADDEITADSSADAGEDAHEEAAAVFHASAVFVGALVGVGAQKLLHEIAVRRVDLHAVGTGQLGVDRRLHVLLDQIVNVLDGHLARQNGRAADDGVELHARSHGLTAAIAGRGRLAAAVMQLDEDLRAVAMHRLTDELEALDLPAVIDAELDGVAVAAVGVHGGEFRNDEAAAALGAILIETDLLRRGAAVPVAHERAHGRHNDAVAQLKVPDLSGLKQFFVLHEAFLLFLLEDSETDAVCLCRNDRGCGFCRRIRAFANILTICFANFHMHETPKKA